MYLCYNSVSRFLYLYVCSPKSPLNCMFGDEIVYVTWGTRRGGSCTWTFSQFIQGDEEPGDALSQKYIRGVPSVEFQVFFTSS